MTFEGGCECRGVRYRVDGPLRSVVNCHCGQCRRVHGHVAAFASAAKADLTLTADAGLAWYDSSPAARRGFCKVCGASLFWEARDADDVGVAAGTLDGPTGLETVGHIYVADAGDYYRLDDGLPRFAQDDGGKLSGQGGDG